MLQTKRPCIIIMAQHGTNHKNEIKMTDIIQIIVAAISGGLFTQIFNFVLSKQKAEKDEFDAIVDQWQSDNKRLREENQTHISKQNELFKKIADLEKRISNLNTKLLIMESAGMNIPLPTWLKDLDGTMLAINDSYELYFLKPIGKKKEDYIGKTDFDIWDEDVAKVYKENDLAVLHSEKKIWFGEEPIVLNGKDVTKDWKTLKYVRFAGDLEIGIGGMAIPAKGHE